MTAADRTRIRNTIDQEARARREARQIMHHAVPRQPRRGPVNHCGYCGMRCYGRVCPSHRDLVQLEAAIYQ